MLKRARTGQPRLNQTNLYRSVSFKGNLMAEIDPYAHVHPDPDAQAGRLSRTNIEQFLAALAHELRSPLHGIQTWTHVLEAQLIDASPAMQRALTGVKTAVDQQVRLLDSLLDAATVLGGSLRLSVRPVVLRGVLDEAIKAVSDEAANKQISLSAELRLQDQCVSGEPRRIRQLVVNLLENAIRYTPAGGGVKLSARVHQLLLTEGHGRALIVVQDNGRGFDQSRVAHLFEPFCQSDDPDGRDGRRGAGVGLGLAVTRQLAMLHGGSVTGRSAGENRGSEFSVNLPLCPR